jgi:hypothetical protein
MTRTTVAAVAVTALLGPLAPAARAHDGPPFPIVSDRVVGPYRLSIWTDPDTTDDGTPGGQFWVRLNPERSGVALPADTRAQVGIRPVGRSGPERHADAGPVRGDVTNQFAAVLMDHEGRFAVHVTVQGPLGNATVDAEVDATYDLRPPAYLLPLYLAPFIAVGLLWGRLMLRRRRPTVQSSRGASS